MIGAVRQRPAARVILPAPAGDPDVLAYHQALAELRAGSATGRLERQRIWEAIRGRLLTRGICPCEQCKADAEARAVGMV